MTIPEQAGKVATSVTETFRTQPALLFLTIINLAFLVCAYYIGSLVLEAYTQQQTQIHQRYTEAIRTIDRCIYEAFNEDEVLQPPGPPALPDGIQPPHATNGAPYGGPR